MSPRKLAWRIYFAAALVVYGVFFAWASWKSATCAPVEVPLALRAGVTYETTSRLFASEKYHAAFRFDGVTPDSWQWWEHTDQALWKGAPPAIHLEVFDRSGRRIIDEASEMSRAKNWIVTASVGWPHVEVYKFLDLRGANFQPFRVRLTVVRGTTANAHAAFILKRLCNYEGVLYILVFVGITVVFGAAAGLMSLVFWMSKAR